MGVPPNSLRRHSERNTMMPDLGNFQFTFDFHDAIEPDVRWRQTKSLVTVC